MLVHSALGVLGVTDPVPLYLEELDARDGWILESRIDRQHVKEVGPFLVQPLLSRIFSSSQLHGFLCIVEITQERSSGGVGGGLPRTVWLWLCNRHMVKK